MAKIKPRIIAFINSCSQFKTGSDMVFIEIAKRLKDYEMVIVTPSVGKTLCQNCGLRRKFLLTTQNETPEFGNVIITYIKRTFKALFLKIGVKDGDVLLGASDFFTDVLPILWLKLWHRKKKIKWIQHIFHLIPSSRKIPFYSQRISLFLVKHWADKVTVDNSLLKDDSVRKFGFNPQKIIVNYPGIDLHYLEKIKANKKNAYDAIFMAQLRPSKGIFDLIKIWSLVCQQKPELKLGIIGRGKKEIVEAMKKMVKDYDMEKNITFLSYLPDDRAYSMIKSAQVFITPSYEEGFGISMLEAQFLGRPVVAWHLPVFDEIFKKGMVKVKVGDLERFAREVVRLLTDNNFYQKFSKEAVVNAKQYDWDKSVRGEEQIFSSLYANKK